MGIKCQVDGLKPNEPDVYHRQRKMKNVHKLKKQKYKSVEEIAHSIRYF